MAGVFQLSADGCAAPEGAPTGPLPPSRMDFSAALLLLKEGRRLRRAGWNGKGMFVFLVPGGLADDPRPDSAGTVPALPYLAMWTATGEVVPWLISQTDALASDWEPAFP